MITKKEIKQFIDYLKSIDRVESQEDFGKNIGKELQPKFLKMSTSEIFGHSDEKMTEIYANFINQIRFAEAQNIKLEVF